MKKITYLLSLLALSTATVNAQTPTFTPITSDGTASSLNNLTTGWYQVKWSAVQSGQTDNNISSSITNGTNFWLNCENEHRQNATSSYPLKFNALDENKVAASFIHIANNNANITTANANFVIQVLNGHYVDNFCKAQRGSSNNTITTYADGTFSVTHFSSYTAGSESPLIGRSGNKVHRIQISKVSDDFINTNFDKYTVSISGAANASEVRDDANITCTSADNKGIAKVYNNGVYFFSKGANVQKTDFTASDVSGKMALIEVDNTAKTINVIYVETKSYDEFTALLSLSDVVGYPKSTSAPYIALKEAYDACAGTVTDDMYLALNDYLTCTDVIMPTEGKAYYIKSIQATGDNDLQFYIENEALALSTTARTSNDAIFICKKDETNDGYAFINANGGYLAWKKNNSGGINNNKGYNTVYNANCEAFILTKSGNEIALTDSKAFGTFSPYILQRDGSTGGAAHFAINPSGAYDVFSVRNGVTQAVISGYSSLLRFEEVPFPYNTVNLKTAGNEAYASLYLPFAVTLPEGITAYTGSINGNSLAMTAVEGNVVPTATAVILKGAAGEETLLPALLTEASTIDKGDLQGTIETTANTGNTYALSGASGTIGFYPYTASNLPRGKAYLTLTSGAQGLTMNFDGEATGIEGIENGTSGNKACYDLSGRRVLNPTKGLYIIGGKKVYVK